MITRARSYLSGAGLGPILIKATSGSAGVRIIGMGLAFLVGVQLARYLGVAGYGVYGLAMSIVTLLGVPTRFGLPQLTIREVAVARANSDWYGLHGILQWTSRLVLGSSALIVTATFTWLALSGGGRESQFAVTLMAGLLVIPLAAQGAIRGAALRGMQHIVTGQVPEIIIRPAAHAALLFFAALFWAPVTAGVAMLLGAASAAIALVVAAKMLKRALPANLNSYQPKSKASRWLKATLPMAASEGMLVLQSQVAILLLGILSSTEDVGLYRVASSVLIVIGFPVSLMNMGMASVIAQLHAENQPLRLKKLLVWMALCMTAGVVVLSVPFILFGSELLGFIFGAEFSESSLALSILSVGLILSAFCGGNSVLLNMVGQQTIVARGAAISVAINIALGGALTHSFGLVGAAVAASLSMVVWHVVMLVYAQRRLGMSANIFSVRLLWSGQQ